MCFIPFVSLLIAITEFVIAYYIYKNIKNKKLYPIFFFVIFLWLYQISEIILCKSNTPDFWARIGFTIYTFLPIFIYHFFINVLKLKFKKIIYIIPIFFGYLAIFNSNFIDEATCNPFHISAKLNLITDNIYLMLFYRSYYFILPIYVIFLFILKVKTKPKINIKSWAIIVPLAILLAIVYHFWLLLKNNLFFETWINITILIITIFLIFLLFISIFIKSKNTFYKLNLFILVITWLLILISFFIVPKLTLTFASVFCQFAILYAIESLIIVKAIKWKQI